MGFEEAGKKLDQEIHKIVEYLEKEALPSARKDTSKFLRFASERLQKLAEKLEKEQSEK
ncbi:MAG: hypothetical protein PHX83_07775 [Acidobacteriia bacterium]|nr:hypothetical protein [Terriglobia bacterium]